MNKEIYFIVITGGPCAGKTSALKEIYENFSKIGYKVLIIPETATELILAGITPMDIGNVNFQKILLKKQVNKEKLFAEAALNMSNDKILILCDRGVLDGKAYMSEIEFNNLLKDIGLNEIQLRDCYHAIFHLVTTAKGAENAYTLENNSARSESLEKARELDSKIIDAWSGHPYLKIIDNSTNFKEKINRLLKEISNLLGEDIPLNEKRYLVSIPNIGLLKEKTFCNKTNIVQTYLMSNDNTERRIRQRGINGNYVYTYTEKRNRTTKERIGRIISEKEYAYLMNQADTSLHLIKKERYCFVYNNQYFSLDIYPFCQDKAILGIDYIDEEANIDIPSFFNVIKDVSNDLSYRNYNLAKTLKL